MCFSNCRIVSLFLQRSKQPILNTAPSITLCQGVKPDDGDSLVSRLAVKLRPRYHFAGMRGPFFERLPYRNHRVMATTMRHVTRFIGMAAVGNPEKQKWIYAFNIVPMSKMERSELIAQPGAVTDMPYNESHLRAASEQKSSSQFFYDMSAPMEDQGRKRKKRDQNEFRAKRPPPKPQGPCWFCLSSDEVEKHLVVSIGDHSYLALPKGPLNENHVLVLPISHHQSALDLPDEAAEEIEKFKTALRKLFRKESLAPVFFERNYRSHHMQLQVVAVPKTLGASVKQTFSDIGSSMQIEMDDVPDSANLSQLAQPGTPFFYVELPETKEKLYHRVRSGFPIQFGREVMASKDLLDMESRIDWRECQVDQDKETQMTLDFRKRFAPFDFTLEDSDED